MKQFNPRLKRRALIFDRLISPILKERRKIANSEIFNPKTILLIDLERIGDLVMLSPFIEALAKNYPNAEIDLIAADWAGTVLKTNSAVKNIFNLNAPWVTSNSWIRFLAKVFWLKSLGRERNWDLAVDMRGDIRSIWLLNILRPKIVVGYDFTGGSKILNMVVPDDGTFKSIIKHHEQILESILGRREALIPSIKLSEDELIEAAKYDAYIGLHFEASNSLRQYPVNEAVLLIEYLTLSSKLPIILFTTNASSGYVAQIMDGLAQSARERLKTWSGSLRNLIVIMSRASAVYCVDSGPSHIAAALNVKTYIIYGPNVYAAAGPVNKNVHPIQREQLLHCQPCDQKCCNSSVEFQECYRGSSRRAIAASKA